MFDPSQLTIASLPSVAFDARRDLPQCQGIYFVVKPDTLLYIGKAKNIFNRWLNHHRATDLSHHEDVSIFWLALEGSASLLDEAERACIAHFAPLLNGVVPPPQDNDLIEIAVPIAGWVYEVFARRAKEQMRTARYQIAFDLEEWLRDDEPGVKALAGATG